MHSGLGRLFSLVDGWFNFQRFLPEFQNNVFRAWEVRKPVKCPPTRMVHLEFVTQSIFRPDWQNAGDIEVYSRWLRRICQSTAVRRLFDRTSAMEKSIWRLRSSDVITLIFLPIEKYHMLDSDSWMLISLDLKKFLISKRDDAVRGNSVVPSRSPCQSSSISLLFRLPHYQIVIILIHHWLCFHIVPFSPSHQRSVVMSFKYKGAS